MRLLKNSKKFLFFTLLLQAVVAFADSCCTAKVTCCDSVKTECCETKKSDCCDTSSSCPGFSKNFWLARPFSSYALRELVMLQDMDLKDDWSSVLSMSTDYMQSFGDSEARLGSLPFWSGCNSMTIGKNDGKSDLDAYQFGLGDVLEEGSITFTPKVKHVGTEFLWHIQQHPYDCGFYFQWKVPVGAMQVEYNVCEDAATVSKERDPDWDLYPAQSVRFKTVSDALYGGCDNVEPDYKFGRLYKGKKSNAHFGDVEVSAGYNVLACDDGYLGLGFKVSFPTSMTPTADFMVEPLFGRAGMWGVGGELRGSYKLWECDNTNVYVHAKAEALHLRSGRRPSWRSFDLATNGPGSKYMLVQLYLPSDFLPDLQDPINFSRTESGWSPSEIQPAINITTRPVHSKFSVEGNVEVMFDAITDNWNYGLSLGFWGRSRECLSFDCGDISEYGDQHLDDYVVLGRQIDVDDKFDPSCDLFLCEPLARINQSEDRVVCTAVSPQADPNGMGSPPATTDYDSTKIKDARLLENRIPRDLETALDVAGAAADRVFSGKVSGKFGYTWTEHEHAPSLTLVGGVEFSDRDRRTTNLWSVALQGSLKF